MENKLYTEEQVRKIAKLYRHELYTLDAAINTETPIELPIIEYLKEKIKKDEENKDHWEENHQQPMADYYRTIAVNRIAAFKEVIEFINENFNEND